MRITPLTRRAALSAALAAAVIAPGSALADGHHRSRESRGGELLVSGSEYTPANIQSGITELPPGCTSGCTPANSGGTYPYVFNNDLVDGSFGSPARSTSTSSSTRARSRIASRSRPTRL